MKKVFLIGDSIRHGIGGETGHKFGYGYYVKKKLECEMEVFDYDDNSRFLQYTFRYLHDWANELGIGADTDIVHWNNGLWDTLRFAGDEPFTSVEMYKEYLLRVYKRIKTLFPDAKVIFALTTPVIEELGNKDFSWKNSDIEEYNNVAIKTLEPLGVIINDLYSAAKEIQREHHLDCVHFNEEGSSILADKVVEILRDASVEERK